jgi:selenocysteine lyase/cysteine desulfurase
MSNFPCKKHLFSLPDDVTYLNCATMSPLSKAVEAAGHKALAWKAQPQTMFSTDFFEPVTELKHHFAQLINCPEPQRIALIPSVSYGMAIVERNFKLKRGENIVLVGEQFPSNVYAWLKNAKKSGGKVTFVPPPTNFSERGATWNEAILAAINPKTRLVAMGNVHWADGTWFDLLKIRAKTREMGALLVIDATQSLGAMPFDVQKIQPDALITAGYKFMFGGYAQGLAYFSERFDGGEPLEENWVNRLGSEDFRTLINYQPLYKPMANRYCAGEHSNFTHVAMLNASIQQLFGWGIENMQTYLKNITKRPLDEVKNTGCWVENEEFRCGHIFGIRLSEEFDGVKFQENLVKNKVFVSFRGTSIRVSPNVYNDENDVMRLVECLKAAKR